MKKDLYIVGAGGLGREIAWLVERINQYNDLWNLKGFIDENRKLWGKKENGIHVLAGFDYLKDQTDAYVVCAVGSAKLRKQIIDKLRKYDVRYATLIDPSAIVSPRVEVGEGSVICANSIITINVNIGKHVLVNLNCTIGHDTIIEDYVTLYPSVNVSGNVIIKKKSEVGTGSQIIQGKTICDEVVIGAGAVVLDDIISTGTYVGVPAQKLEKVYNSGCHQSIARQNLTEVY